MIIVLKILDVIGEETKLLLPGSRIIIGRMHMQYPNFTNFPPSSVIMIGKVFFLCFTRKVILASHPRGSI